MSSLADIVEQQELCHHCVLVVEVVIRIPSKLVWL